MKLKVLLRKIKAKITGVVPCSFESVHGHDITIVGDVKFISGMPYAKCECIVCNKKFMVSKFFGLEAL